MLKQTIIFAAIAGLVFAVAPAARAVEYGVWPMPTVTVGNPKNTADTRYDATGYGAAPYEYNMGTYLVTNGQYCDFLNGVDADGTNPHNVYSALMGSDPRGGISLTPGNPIGSKYATRPNMADKPVTFATWYDSLRFVNWLNNGQGAGDTEDGVYDMTQNFADPASPARNPGTNWWLPSEDEWYKAAYYDGGSSTYYDYPTGSNTAPTAVQAVDTGDFGNMGDGRNGDNTDGSNTPVTSGNYANMSNIADWNGQNGNVTTVGTNGGPSPYGTFDQAGLMWEWLEEWTGVYRRRQRGGDWSRDASFTHASFRADSEAGVQYPDGDRRYGFRVAGFMITDVPGDVDGDGDVDLADMSFFEAQFGDAAPGEDSCDFDDDGDVDLDDLAVMRDNFGYVSPAPSAATPEPTTLIMLAAGLSVLSKRKRRA